ncbi:hypothetical protein MTBUT4_110112 [Magnetospirillum sp. UT-4]|nr:hypothetical protein MTBUT4_110112 [Magnetospirillum sp. UT-4]
MLRQAAAARHVGGTDAPDCNRRDGGAGPGAGRRRGPGNRPDRLPEGRRTDSQGARPGA